MINYQLKCFKHLLFYKKNFNQNALFIIIVEC